MDEEKLELDSCMIVDILLKRVFLCCASRECIWYQVISCQRYQNLFNKCKTC